MIKVCEKMPSEYKTPALILALTGCRSAEIGKGVQISIDHNDLIECKINGVKVSKNKGHEERTIVFDPDANIFAEILKAVLVDHLKVKSKTFYLPGGSSFDAVRIFGDRIRYAAQKHLGLKGVSAYSFRHQFASDLRMSGFDQIDMAMALGHKTTRMRKHYGLQMYGKGGRGIYFIDASEKDFIRQTVHEKPSCFREDFSGPQLSR